MRLRLAERFQHKTIYMDDGDDEIVWSKDDPAHEVEGEAAKKAQHLVDMGYLVTDTTDPDPDPEEDDEDDEESGPFQFDEWIKTWDGTHLPKELNSKTELKGLHLDQLQKMCKALDISDKGLKPDIIASILEEFDG